MKYVIAMLLTGCGSPFGVTTPDAANEHDADVAEADASDEPDADAKHDAEPSDAQSESTYSCLEASCLSSTCCDGSYCMVPGYTCASCFPSGHACVTSNECCNGVCQYDSCN